MNKRNFGSLAVLTLVLAVPFLANAEESEAGLEQHAVPAVFCQQNDSGQCEIKPEIRELLDRLARQAAYEKLQAEIDAWDKEITPDYE